MTIKIIFCIYNNFIYTVVYSMHCLTTRKVKSMLNRVQNNNGATGNVFPPTSTIRIDDTRIQALRQEGLEIRSSIEKSAANMFASSSSNSSTRMR